MPRPLDLPDHLRDHAFLSGAVDTAGISRTVLRRADISSAFHGVHVHGGAPQALAARCAALILVLGDIHAFSHITAARLWGMPLPAARALGDDLHVIAIGARGRIRRPGVTSWETAPDVPRRMLGDLPVVPPADVWAQLSGIFVRRGVALIDVAWLVAIADFLVSGVPSPGGRRSEPLCTLPELVDAAQRRRGKRGAKALTEALRLVRVGPDSPKESLLRVGLVHEGLPEPEIHPAVATSAGERHPDLGYIEARLLLEYQGDHHRTDRATWLSDLTRVQLFEDAGFRTMLIGDADVYPDCRALAARVRRHLARTRKMSR